MRKPLPGCCLTCVLALSASAAAAQEKPEPDFDYDALVEELPIESKVFDPPLTFRMFSGGEIRFYGQFNPAYQGFNDGEETTSNLVDNGNWNSRLGFILTQPADGVLLRARFETGLGFRNSAMVSQDYTPDWINWDPIWLRWFEVAGESRYGTLSIGQGSTASDGTAGLDDSFTFVAGATDSTDGFGAFRFRNGDGELTNVTVGAVNNSFDGARRFRARYDTPIFSGMMLSTSYGQNILVEEDNRHYYDMAIRWTGEVGDFAIRAAASYQWQDNPDGKDTRRVAGSGTIVHGPTGLNVAVSFGQQVDGASYVWGRAGWQEDVLEIGNTSLSVDFYSGYDFLSDAARTLNYGVYGVQSIDAASLDIYAGIRKFTYSDDLGTDYQDAYGVLTGMRFHF